MVTDSSIPMLTATYTYSLTVGPALVIATLGPLPAGQQQYVSYAPFTMQAQGGMPPINGLHPDCRPGWS
jgi:hypothetical protein